MAMVQRSYPGSRRYLSRSNMDLSREKPISRLVIMQARFQQRQLQEKEEKLLKLYEEQRERALQRVGAQNASSPRRWSGGQVPVKPGKVRSLLQSRRDLGNDKSYPLDPMPTVKTQKSIKTKKTAPVLYFGGSHQDLRFSDELDFGQSFQVIDDHYGAPSNNDSDGTDEDYFIKSFRNKRQFYENRFSGVSEESLSDSFDAKVFQKLPNVGGLKMSQKMESPGKYKTFVSAKTTRIPPPKSGLPLKQSMTSPITKKPEITPPVRPRLDSSASSIRNGSASPPVRSPTVRSIPTRVESPGHINGGATASKSLNGSATTRKPQSPPQSLSKSSEASTRSVVPPVPASRTTVPKTSSATLRTSPTKSAAPANLSGSGCRVCGRSFAPDRLEFHESICKKAATKKRKVFDPVKHRVQGTEAEKYVIGGISAKNAKQAEKVVAATKANWRKKHEDFINSIRAAKEVQVHLKKGGKLSDLPPPPPSDYSDYVQCPHCQRKFNQTAADRHIPKCANMMHNKTKKISAPLKPSSTFRKK